MQSNKNLFDHDALSAHRGRVSEKTTDAFFLHDIAIDEVKERLKDVNRSFTSPLIVGWQADRWATNLGLEATCKPDSDILDVPPKSFDLALHALCLHSANDPIGQLIQMRHALKPDGLMIVVLFAANTLTELRRAFTQAESEVEGGISPRVSPFAELRDLGGLLQRSGFALPVADTKTIDTEYASPLHLMHELRGMAETNILCDRRKTFLRRDTLNHVLQCYPKSLEGKTPATFELAFLTGWSPSETQPKPLKPGSAKMLLRDALNPKIKGRSRN